MSLPAFATETTVSTQDALNDAVASAEEGDTITIGASGDYTLPNIPRNITIKGDVAGVVFSHTGSGNIASIPNGATFENVSFEFGNNNYHGFQHAGNITMTDCTLNGKLFSYGNMTFGNCTFNQSNSDYHMWCYGPSTVTYNNCNFTNSVTGKFINVYREGSEQNTVIVTGCKFTNNGSLSKAALNVKATSGSVHLTSSVTIKSCTTEGSFPAASSSEALVVIDPLVQVDDIPAGGNSQITVTLDNAQVYPEAAKTYVAQIGDAKYETLEAAFAAAVDGDTITLLADCAGNGIKATPAGKFSTGLTVDFANHTYTVDGDTVGSSGTETNGFQLLKNNKITFQNGTITSAKAKILVQNYSNLTLDNMTLTLDNPNYTSAYTLSNNNGDVSIQGSTINANPAGGFAFDVCRYASYPSVNVTVQKSYDYLAGTDTESVINGNIEISASKGDAKDGFSLTLTSGTLNGNIVLDGSVEDLIGEENVTVTKTVAFTATAPAGFAWEDSGTLVKGAAEITKDKETTVYDTLEAAFAAAADGDTITLRGDCAGNGIKAPQGKFTTGLTVDFNGHTYTVDGETVGSSGTETNGFQLLKDNKITFKGGTITSAKAKILIQNYSNLTLDKMTLTLNNPNYASAYTLSNNNGNVVINDTTINANPAGAFAFDVCRYASYPSVSVTVTGESVINGNVEISASGSNAKEGFSLTLESGTLNGNIVLDQTAKNAMAATLDKATVTKAATFEQDAPEGYYWADGEENQVLVQCTAKIGDTFYPTLQSAVNAVEDNGVEPTTITVLKDSTEGGVMTVANKPKNVIIDFGGHVLTIGNPLVGSPGTVNQSFHLEKGSTFVLKNGEIYSDMAKILIQNYCNLTLDNMKVGRSTDTYSYTVSCNNGKIKFTNETVITAAGDGYAFDVCVTKHYPDGAQITIDNATINGKVQYDVWTSIPTTGNKASLTVTGGTFNTGAFVVENALSEIAPACTEISGGTFDFEPSTGYIKSGYEAVELTPGKWTVALKAADTEVETVEKDNTTTTTKVQLVDTTADAKDSGKTFSIVTTTTTTTTGETENTQKSVNVVTVTNNVEKVQTEAAQSTSGIKSAEVSNVLNRVLDKAKEAGRAVASIAIDVTPTMKESSTASKYVFNIEPVAVATTDGDKVSVEVSNEEIEGNIKSKIEGLPTEWEYVKITHTSDFGIETAVLKTEQAADESRYVEFTTTHFSEFAVERSELPAVDSDLATTTWTVETVDAFGGDYDAISLVLGGSIEMKFYFHSINGELVDKIKVVNADGTKYFSLSDLSHESDDELSIKVPVYAVDMSSTVELSLIDAEGRNLRLMHDGVETNKYKLSFSVKDYWNALSDSYKTENLTALIQSMYRYGNFAENWWYKGETGVVPTQSDIEAVHAVSLTDITSSNTISKNDVTLDGVSGYSFSLVLNTATEIKFYFTATDTSGLSVKVNGEATEFKPSGVANEYYVRISNIYAQDLDEVQEISVTKGNATKTYSLSALSYAKLLTENDSNIVRIVKSMYLYNLAANRYFKS